MVLKQESYAYSESTPAPYLAIVGEGKCARVASSNLDKDGVGGECVRGNGGGYSLARVEALVSFRVILVDVRVFVVNVPHTAVPGGVPSQSTLVVDAPGEELVVVGQSNGVHATTSDLYNTDGVRGEVRI